MDDENGEPERTDNIVKLPSLAERQRMQRETAMRTRSTGAAGRSTAKDKPFINLPPATKAMLAVLVGIHLVLTFLVDPATRFDIQQRFGFIPGAFTGAAPFTPLTLLTPLTYMLLHGGWTHLAMNCLMLAAFGAGVERWIGGRRMVIFSTLCGIAAAAAHLTLNPFSPEPTIGASGALSGLFAAVLVMTNDMRSRMGETATKLLPVVIIWIVITIGSGMIGMPTGTSIAWAAHVGGFLAGFAILRVMKIWR